MKQLFLLLLSILRPNEKPTLEELRAWALEQVRKEHQVGIWICENCRKKAYASSAGNTPERNTEKPPIIQEPRGRYFQEHRHEYTETQEVPKASRQTRDLRNFHFTRLVLDTDRPDDTFLL